MPLGGVVFFNDTKFGPYLKPVIVWVVGSRQALTNSVESEE
jgi:hypothetical protein